MFNHGNIVQLKEAFKRKGKLHMVFEYVDKSLLEVLEQQPSGLNPQDIQKFIYQLCKAIDCLHRNNVVHRDIKPENLLVNKDGSLKLCDFGFARLIPQKRNEMTDYVATRWYRSPELALSSTDYGPPVDIWAIGCILGELADGKPLFPGENEIDQLFVIQKVLGPLTPEQIEMFEKNPRFVGVKFPDFSQPETLDKRYLGKLSKKALSFMKECLKMDPSQRITTAKALQHPYFDGIRDIAEPANSKQDLRIVSADVMFNQAKPSNQNTTTKIQSKLSLNMTLDSQSNLGTRHANLPHTKPELAPLDSSKNLALSKKNGQEANPPGLVHKTVPGDKIASDRPLLQNSNASKLELLQQTYDPKRKKEQVNFAQQSYNGAAKKHKTTEVDHIDGNFVVPDVFMKTNYGSTSQYNYDIKTHDGPMQDNFTPKKFEKLAISTIKDLREPQTDPKKAKPLHIKSPGEETFREGKNSPLLHAADESARLKLSKDPMQMTSNQFNKMKFSSTMYGGFREGDNKPENIKPKPKKFKDHMTPVFDHEAGHPDSESRENIFHQPNNQFPYLGSKRPAEKTHTNNLEVIHGSNGKGVVGWKGAKVILSQDQPSSIHGGEKANQFNSTFYNYNFTGSLNHQGASKNKKRS